APRGPGIRLDSGIERGSVVSYHFDPLLAKLVVWAPSREAAIERMKRALSDFALLGVRNNIEFLGRIVSTDDFAAGKIDTGFLDQHPNVFAKNDEIPIEAILAASITPPRAESRVAGGRARENAFGDVWNYGVWRNS